MPRLRSLAFVYCPFTRYSHIDLIWVIEHLLCAGITLGTGETAGNKTDTTSALRELVAREGNDIQGGNENVEKSERRMVVMVPPPCECA